MKKMLFYGHEFHKKTKSNLFFIEILERDYDVYRVYEDPYTGNVNCDEDLSGIYFDVLVLWQLIPNRKVLDSKFRYKQGVFVPMYDGFNTNRYWWEYYDFKVLCFSEAVERISSADGIPNFRTKYYIEPAETFEYGDEKSVFLWQRREAIDGNRALTILKDFDINTLHIHKALDPNERFVEPEADGINVEYSTWYEDPNDMMKDIIKSAFYVAPRQYEGIGMSFLEAMSNGRCVVAPNLPTMNEYIVDGVNGILYDWETNELLGSNYDIASIQENAYRTACEGYEKWMESRWDILDWIADDNILINHYGKERLNRLRDTTYMIGQMADGTGYTAVAQVNKFRELFRLEDAWLELIFKGGSVENNLVKRGYKSVAIYGMSRVGWNLERDLSRSNQVELLYAVDRNKEKVQLQTKLDVYAPDEELPNVDVVLVTAITDYENIKMLLESRGLNAVSAKDIVAN